MGAVLHRKARAQNGARGKSTYGDMQALFSRAQVKRRAIGGLVNNSLD